MLAKQYRLANYATEFHVTPKSTKQANIFKSSRFVLRNVSTKSSHVANNVNHKVMHQASSNVIVKNTLKNELPNRKISHRVLQNLSTTTLFKTEGISVQVRHFAGAGAKVIKVPPMGDSISEGTIKKWHKKTGDFVKTDDLIVSIETDKIVVEIRAPENGAIGKIYPAEGVTIAVGADLYELDASAKGPVGGAAPPKEAPKEAPKATTPEAPKKAPETAKPEAPKVTEAPKPDAPKVAAPVGDRSTTRQQMTRLRNRVAERLKEAQNTYAMLTTFNEIDMTNIIGLRNAYKDEFEKKHGVKLGFMSAFVKAVVSALQEQPLVNAVIEEKEIVYRNFYDVSVAVATPTGLVVPVLRDCDKLSFAGVEKALADLGKKARDQKLAIEDMSGGTFTISNGGVYGSMMGTPIINPPQSAILGMHAVKNRAVVVGDKIESRPVMYIALTYDHRLIDGREAVTFLKKVKDNVEDPRRLLLDL